MEAEAVALLCCEALGLEGTECCRGYIQEWFKRSNDSVIPEKSVQKSLRLRIRFSKRAQRVDGIRQDTAQNDISVSTRISLLRHVTY